MNTKSKSKYIKLSHLEHILTRPDSYIGSVESDEKEMYVVENTNLSNFNIVKKKIKYNPGFLKIYDEIITNASDHSIRTEKVKIIKIDIEDKRIVVQNDGPTVPIEIHEDEKVYIPQMLWMDLLTGENYDDTEVREVAGKNGYGSKLCNIYSKKFIIECCDGKVKYTQTARNNMKDIDDPIINVVEKGTKSYTKITYYPDYSKFDFGNKITTDIRSLMYKRALDLSVYIPKVRVIIDKKTIPIKKISDFMSMHLPENIELFHETLSNGWEIGISKSNQHGFESVSICNGLSTYEGGTHVNFISLIISKEISSKMKKVTWVDVKNKLFVFLIAKVPNPSFDTQTKVNLTTKMTSDVHKNAELSQSIIRKIMKSDIVQSILDEQELKEKLQLKRMGGGKKSKVNLPKLQDANRAGTRDSDKCFLMLTEGDSALSTAIAGMSVVGRDYYGAFPLKGKILNVRDASTQKIKQNKEIQSLLNITGLEFGKTYTNTSELRYGKIIIFTDADCDGIHIKGLLLNFIENNWPELIKMDFIYEFITPILKVKKGNKVKSFYTLKEYQSWLSHNPKGWDVKYYKGLGTSTPKEAKEYFQDINKHLLPFLWDTDKNHDKIDLVFRSKRSDDRKNWILKTNPKDVEKYETPTLISSFMDNEMITFSIEDNIRSIPELYDGLKPSQRKIIHTIIKKNIIKDYPVSSLGGLTKSESKYHHGEVSLEQSIVNLAQNFVGSNNINLLVPEGQFGSRLQGGKDSASSRYINTYLSEITKIIFNKKDNKILNYLEEDGYKIEPETFKPIIPMILVNGTEGIGTGWSTNIPKYNPKDVLRVIENKLNGKKSNKIHPWYNNFKGDIIKSDNGYITRGKWEILNTTTIKITELPIGYWTQNFIEYLHKLIDIKFIKDFIDNSTETDINITILIPRENMIKISSEDILISKFKLESKVYTSNMHLFVDGKITKFSNPEDIIDMFYKMRLKDYQVRKDSMLKSLMKERTKLDNQVRFIKAVISSDVKINNRKKDLIVKDLNKSKYDLYDGSYDYLLRMSLYSLTKEKIDELTRQAKEKLGEIKTLKKTKIKELWLFDLAELKKYL